MVGCGLWQFSSFLPKTKKAPFTFFESIDSYTSAIFVGTRVRHPAGPPTQFLCSVKTEWWRCEERSKPHIRKGYEDK